MKDKDEPKRPAICSRLENQRPSTSQRPDNTVPPPQDPGAAVLHNWASPQASGITLCRHRRTDTCDKPPISFGSEDLISF